ncbi:hypothetical protein CS022_17865 [Veronia nyctiphanis]|uniref:Tetratricopeptide repeat protein n=1 Tax=Veronia nyctiphanis TaxID=1278244 RepID=A0A4Q0YQ50_9GAMM|nr:tetratricopeptide repeat protein [Veronia nyctiphanis]RXJ72134.1 hypothetical protein CS022_17865 [Veronia nyctiphanis]
MEYQRDHFSICHLKGFFYRCGIWLLAVVQKKQLLKEWQEIKIADHLRAMGARNTAIRLSSCVATKTENRRNQFWAYQVHATSLQYVYRYPESEKHFQKALQLADELERSFALQHYGKSLVEQHRHIEAKAVLKEALEIRRKLKQSKLVQSTEIALAHLKSSTA